MRYGMGSGWAGIAVCGLLWAIGAISGADLAMADDAAAVKPLPLETLTALDRKTIAKGAPVYIRIFKESSELEVWMARDNGRYLHVKTFPICTWSGSLGPKEKLGDLMAPEGFYSLGPDSLKPDSKFHLALNVGYPNALDRALGRTGNFIMVHGKCASVGCFAMTDDLMEEIYAFAREAFDAGVETIPVHIFPFRMTPLAMTSHAGHAAYASWAPLKEAFDDFAVTRQPPRIGACGKRYVVNPLAKLDGPADACPAVIGKLRAPISPKSAKKLAVANVPLVADGIKTRNGDGSAAWGAASMLGFSQSVSPAVAPAAKTVSPAIGDHGSMTPFLNR